MPKDTTGSGDISGEQVLEDARESAIRWFLRRHGDKAPASTTPDVAIIR